MTWEESNEKCEGLQMRPPTRKEIKAAYNANLTDSWKKDGLWYWTSEKFSKEYAYYFNVEDGNVSNIVNFYSIHLRCIR